MLVFRRRGRFKRRISSSLSIPEKKKRKEDHQKGKKKETRCKNRIIIILQTLSLPRSYNHSPYLLSYNPYDVTLKNLVLDQLIFSD